MIKVMFVCHGNICRSPMAEFIFKDLIKNEGLSDKFIVKSSATSAEEIHNGVGKPIYPKAKAELERNSILCTEKYAVQLKKEDYDKYDYFLCMDNNNLRNAIKIFGSDKDNKVSLLMSFTKRPADVDDPWYSGDFDLAYQDIYEGCSCFFKSLVKSFKN